MGYRGDDIRETVSGRGAQLLQTVDDYFGQISVPQRVVDLGLRWVTILSGTEVHTKLLGRSRSRETTRMLHRSATNLKLWEFVC